MPQMQPVSVKDRAATPATHTFVPRQIQGNIAELVETTDVPIGESLLRVSLAKTSGRRYKATIKLDVPVVQTATVNGVDNPLVVRKAYADLTFSFDEKSSEQERNDVVGMMASLLSSDKVLINDTIVKLQGIY